MQRVKYQREIGQMSKLLKEHLEFEKLQNGKSSEKDKNISKRLMSVRRELEQLNNEFA